MCAQHRLLTIKPTHCTERLTDSLPSSFFVLNALDTPRLWPSILALHYKSESREAMKSIAALAFFLALLSVCAAQGADVCTSETCGPTLAVNQAFDFSGDCTGKFSLYGQYNYSMTGACEAGPGYSIIRGPCSRKDGLTLMFLPTDDCTIPSAGPSATYNLRVGACSASAEMISTAFWCNSSDAETLTPIPPQLADLSLPRFTTNYSTICTDTSCPDIYGTMRYYDNPECSGDPIGASPPSVFNAHAPILELGKCYRDDNPYEDVGLHFNLAASCDGDFFTVNTYNGGGCTGTPDVSFRMSAGNRCMRLNNNYVKIQCRPSTPSAWPPSMITDPSAPTAPTAPSAPGPSSSVPSTTGPNSSPSAEVPTGSATFISVAPLLVVLAILSALLL